ncbi:MAG: hypothetical protein ACREVK_10045 [Gammaproteobacteria bacterium]
MHLETRNIGIHEDLEGGHSFELLKRSGRSEGEVWEEVVGVIACWIEKSRFG